MSTTTTYVLRSFGSTIVTTKDSSDLSVRLHIAYAQDTGIRVPLPLYAVRSLASSVDYGTNPGGSSTSIGVASDGESYTLYGVASTWSDTGASGSSPQTIVVSGTTTFYSYQVLGSSQLTNVEMRVRVSLSDITSAAGMMARFSGTATHYRFVIVGGQLQLVRQFSSAAVVLATFSIPGFSTGQFYWLRGRIVGNALYGKVWQDGSPEPGNWQCSAVNTQIAGAGSFGLLSKLAITGDKNTFDHFSVVAAVGSFGFIPLRLPLQAPPTLDNLRTRLILFGQTLKDLAIRLQFTGRVTDLRTRIPMALAQDSFHRTPLATSWGVATDGTNTSIAWSKLGAAAFTSTDGTHGLMSLPSGGTIMQLGASLPLIAANIVVTVRTQIGASGDETGIILRLIDANNWYKCDYLDASPAGGYVLRIRKNVNGVITTIAQAPFVMLVGRWYWLRVMAEGSNLYLSAWLDGQPIPPQWLVGTVDTSLLNGGLFGLCGNPTTTTPLKYDSLLVVQVPIRNPNIPIRLRFFNGTVKDLIMRLRLIGQQKKRNLLFRLILSTTRYLDMFYRVVLVPVRLRDITMRVLTLLGRSTGDISLRLPLARARDLLTRLLLQPDPTETLLSLSLKPKFVGEEKSPVIEGTLQTFITPSGQGAIPVSLQNLQGDYMIGPVILDTPDAASAPMSFNGAFIPQGSAFTLAYITPSQTVQNNLVNGAIVTMQFALSTGEMVSGPVHLEVQQLPGGWTITCITQNIIYTNRWRTITQFP